MISKREKEEEEEEGRRKEGGKEKEAQEESLWTERVERKHYYRLPLFSLSVSLSPLTQEKGPDPGWTELGRACRRGAGQGHGTWGHRRDGLGTGQEEYLGRVE